MRKKIFGRQFKRDINERKALFKGLMTELVLRESIKTTLPKAKSIKGQVEKLVTKAKIKGRAAKPLLQPFVSAEAVEKIMSDLAERFVDRKGGYTRIIKTGNRFSDNAETAVIEWVIKKEITKEKTEKPTKKSETEVVEAEVVAPKTEKASKPKAKKTEKKEEKKPAKKATKETK